jgi:hypothetical protein
MNSPRTGLRVGSVLFGIFCLGHIIRLITRLPVTIGTHHIPMWPSAVALIVAASLSLWMWRLASPR